MRKSILYAVAALATLLMLIIAVSNLHAQVKKTDVVYSPVEIVATVILRDSNADVSNEYLQNNCNVRTWVERAAVPYERVKYTQSDKLFATPDTPDRVEASLTGQYTAHFPNFWAVMGIQAECRLYSGLAVEPPVYYYVTPYSYAFPVVFVQWERIKPPSFQRARR